jgi:hypothetical protein
MFLQRVASGLIALLIPFSTFAVEPLITDDADPVDLGHLELDAGWQFSRTASTKLYSAPVNLTYGIASRGELGMTFGYQWQNGNGNDADGITDLALETKWRFIGTATNRFKLSARFDLKLPTASARKSLGTGEPDADIFLIATRSWEKTSLDWNIGYKAVDAAHGNFNDDQWFLGQAVRRQLSGRWTLIGEAYGTFSQGNAGSPASFNFDGGVQFSLRENILLSAIVGSAIGRNSHDLTSYVGFTWIF